MGFFRNKFGKHADKKASRTACLHEEKELREHLSEKQIDKMVADSFPASDPPSTY